MVQEGHRLELPAAEPFLGTCRLLGEVGGAEVGLSIILQLSYLSERCTYQAKKVSIAMNL